MSDFDPESPADNDWNDRGYLAWNEFDWERYLREQDETLNRYLAFYETYRQHPRRIDEVARRMDWEDTNPDTADEADETDDENADTTIYTPLKNPVFIATKALCLRARRSWLLEAGDTRKAPPSLALRFLDALHQAEAHAVQAVQALEFGDYAMAVSLLKRALSGLNQTLALLNDPAALAFPFVNAYRDVMRDSFFDLREIWLRVIAECRCELERPIEDDED